MNKIIDRYLFIIYILPIPLNFQVLSQNHSLYRFVINKKEQQAKFALLTLVKEELPAGEYEVEFKTSSLSGRQAGINPHPVSGIYLYQLKVSPANGGAGEFIQTKKVILIK
jgi:hypothetical protein